MIIIPDSNKVTYLVDSHPDTPEDADYLEVSECDTIEITDKELDDIWVDYEQESRGQGFSKYFKQLIELKIAEKEKNE